MGLSNWISVELLRRTVSRAVAITVLMAPLLVPAFAYAEIRVRCRTAFDSDYFYVAADVDKRILRGHIAAPFADLSSDDRLEVSLELPAAAGGSPRRIEMQVSVAQGAQLYRGADRVPIKGVDDFHTGPDGVRALFKYRLRPRVPLNGPDAPEGGFAVEMGIPWAELGGAPVSGARARFNVAVRSVVEGDPPITSVSPAVITEADLSDPTKWAELVFTDAPVASIAGAPGALVCARVFTVKPVIDGALAEGEWSRVTAFSFVSGSDTRIVGAGTSAMARKRGEVEVKPGRIAGVIASPIVTARTGPLVRQAFPRRVLVRYHVEYQSDPRKDLPLKASMSPDGLSHFVTHPMDGTGPWFSYDRLDWHRIQLSRMREAGIDAAAVVYRPSREGRLALTAMAAAIATMDAGGADAPAACLWLDARELLQISDPRAALAGAIGEFMQCVPARYRLQTPLSVENGSGMADTVIIDGRGMTISFDLAVFLRQRHAREFGRHLILLSVGTMGPGFDGLVPVADGDGYAEDRTGAISIGAIYAGTPGRGDGEHPLLRRTIETYRASWRRAISSGVPSVLIDSWNDYANGTEIGPTVEYGLQYLDTTRANTLHYKSATGDALDLIASDLPTVLLPGTTYSAHLRLRNPSPVPWTAGETAIRATWAGGGSGPAVVLPVTVVRGDPLDITLQVPVPDRSGDIALNLELVNMDRRGTVKPSPKTGTRTLSVMTARIDGDGVEQYRATLVRSSLPRVLEALSSCPVSVTVRNDGHQAWRAKSTKVVARLFELRPGNGMPEFVDAGLADCSALLTEDVPPGAVCTVTVPVTAVRSDGSPYRFSGPDTSRYLLRWDVDIEGDVLRTAPTEPQEVQIVEADFGAQFFNDYTPSRVPADRRIPVPLGIKNRGNQTWLKDQVAVGFHWYYLDGIEAVWEDEVFPLKADVPPGTEIGDVGAWLTAPPNDGKYWLVWDIRVGDTWGSTLTSARTYETRVTLVEVAGGRLEFLDLAPHAQVKGVLSRWDTDAAGFDGTGSVLPAEITPPFLTTGPVPATLWLPELRTGTERSRSLSFRWLSSQGPTLVRPGNRAILSDKARRAPARKVHILAAAVVPGKSLGVTLRFSDNSEQFTSFPIGVWESPPARNDRVAYMAPFTRNKVGDPGPPARLFWYTITVAEPKRLAAVELSDAPDVRIAAITVEH